MNFADLFKPPPLRIARIIEVPTFKLEGKNECDGKESIFIREKPGLGLSALSALVPLDLPFVEGERYRLASAVEWPGHLDLYHVDPDGPWLRRHGVLIAIPEGI